MSFVQSRQSSRRPYIVTAVAALHAGVIYALITGLGVEFTEKVAFYLPTREYPRDVPEPLPSPEPERQVEQTDESIQAPLRDLALPSANDPLIVPKLPDLVIPDIGDLPTAKPGPSPVPDKPSFTPKRAAPRNDPAGWVSTNDYPTGELRQGNQGRVGFTLTVDARGKVTGCTVTSSSGFPGLDEAACKYVSRRASFDPATDASGKPVASTFSSAIRWVIPD